jgi:UDP-glucose 4-epimerase
MGEEICKMYRKVYKTNIEIARFYNVYGPNEIIDGDWAAVIGVWRRQVRDGLPITIVGDGNQRRDFTHVDDIIKGLEMIALSDKTHDDAWELGRGTNFSINEVSDFFKERFNCDKIYLPQQKGNYQETLRINNDALNILGWEPQMDLKRYIQNLN